MKDKIYEKIKIKDLTVEYSVEYRNVKYTRYEIRNGRLRLITRKKNKDKIEELIHAKDKWIYRKITQHRINQKKNRELTKNKKLENRTLNQLKQLVDIYVERYEKQLNVRVNRIQYRAMTRKWGSCSSLKNITLSKDLRHLPDRLVSYIVYHELAHIIIMAHNPQFYEIIEKEFKNYKQYDEELKQYYYLINRTFTQ